MDSKRNVFLTGAAGSGKSFLLQKYLNEKDANHPILASTGAAASIIGGRTFHSFFGLGIMQGGPAKTVERALANTKVRNRLRSANTIIIDEISMISSKVFACAESISRQARENRRQPWGGLRVIVVGDGYQLPPVEPNSEETLWAFDHECWDRTDFDTAYLSELIQYR